MQITKIEPPKKGGTLYWGLAVSTRGLRYEWYQSRGYACHAYREDPSSALPDGRTCWWAIKAPTAPATAVRRAVQKARRSA